MNNYRKILYIGSCLLFANPVYAEIYFGLNAGGSVITIPKKLNYDSTTANYNDAFSSFRAQVLVGYNIHAKNNTISPGLPEFFYETRCIEEFFGALEFNLNYNSDDVSSNISPWFLTTNASVSEKMRYSYDFFILGKYRTPTNIIWFVGPGFTQGKFQIKTNSQTAGNIGVSTSSSTWLSGISIKAGLELPATKFMNIVITSQYSNFNSTTLSSVEPLTGVTVSGNYKPIVYSLTLGLNWF